MIIIIVFIEVFNWKGIILFCVHEIGLISEDQNCLGKSAREVEIEKALKKKENGKRNLTHKQKAYKLTGDDSKGLLVMLKLISLISAFQLTVSLSLSLSLSPLHFHLPLKRDKFQAN
jgi:hypothetical protein